MVAVDPSGGACATRRRTVCHAMSLKTMRRSLAFPPVLTSYKLLEIERLCLPDPCFHFGTFFFQREKSLDAPLHIILGCGSSQVSDSRVTEIHVPHEPILTEPNCRLRH